MSFYVLKDSIEPTKMLTIQREHGAVSSCRVFV